MKIQKIPVFGLMLIESSLRYSRGYTEEPSLI